VAHLSKALLDFIEAEDIRLSENRPGYFLTRYHLARETVSLLTDRTRADAMRRDLAQVRDALGAPGASRRAAKAVLGVG